MRAPLCAVLGLAAAIATPAADAPTPLPHAIEIAGRELVRNGSG